MTKTEILVHAANARIAAMNAEHRGIIAWESGLGSFVELTDLKTEMQKEAAYIQSLADNMKE